MFSARMPCPILQIDAFADRPFAGNPAAVCLLDEPGDPAWMQAVAAEMNLSETAFVSPGDSGYDLRWFTPTIEVDLCGHATLAAAHALWSERQAPEDRLLQFHTRSGTLTARHRGRQIQLDFPATPVVSCPAISELGQALDAPVLEYGKTTFDLFVCLENETTLRELTPDMGRLARLPARGIIATSAAGSEAYDFVARFFAPAAGISEDPVTGSAFCALGPYWRQKTGRRQLVGYQASPRGGTVWTEMNGDRVLLQGTAITVTRGEWIA